MADPFNSMMISAGAGQAMAGMSNMFGQQRVQNAAIQEQQRAREQQMLMFMMSQDAGRRQERSEERQFGMQARQQDQALALRREESAFARLNQSLDRQLQVAEMESKQRQLAFENTLKAQMFDVQIRREVAETKLVEAQMLAPEKEAVFDELLTSFDAKTLPHDQFLLAVRKERAENPLAFRYMAPETQQRVSQATHAAAMFSRDDFDWEALKLGEIKFQTNDDFLKLLPNIDLRERVQMGTESVAVGRLRQLAGIPDGEPGTERLREYLQEYVPEATTLIQQLEADPALYEEQARRGLFKVPSREQAMRYVENMQDFRLKEAELRTLVNASALSLDDAARLFNRMDEEKKRVGFISLGITDPETQRLADAGQDTFTSVLDDFTSVATGDRIVRDMYGVQVVGQLFRQAGRAITGRKQSEIDVARWMTEEAATARFGIEIAEASRSVSHIALQRALAEFDSTVQATQAMNHMSPSRRYEVMDRERRKVVDLATKYGVPRKYAEERLDLRRFIAPRQVVDDDLLPIRARITGVPVEALIMDQNPATWESNFDAIVRHLRQENVARNAVQRPGALPLDRSGGFTDPSGRSIFESE